ncbi:SusD/RagB family nutrient-binding outer membrane lipoprotein [Niabella sp.]|uniref:SusD/RagB family nutrient-binding outer membrane lipoprotein n=1 Tax=Niabella sp. TaxID=1962976 RepID=UPI00261D6017|nr:SusD/RagB family nutrient-binding outer membrane lipoprotein [Niabella sp.]
MKKIIFTTVVIAVTGIVSCTKQQFADHYINPKTVGTTTIEKQFSGFMAADLDYVMYKYWNYFVVLQNTALPWSQAVGVNNIPARFVPGAAAVSDRWSNFYNFLAQYKELLNVYNKSTDEEKAAKKIYITLATIHFYDQSQKVVDLHGDIPWSAAGLLSTNKGDVNASYAKYDKASDIYTKMLDDLKGFAEELNTVALSAPVAATLKSQDFINQGDITLWKKYCNSLRIKLLMRASGVAAFQSRVNTEIASILNNPTSYPVVTSNDDKVAIEVYSVSSGINNGTGTGLNADFYKGLIGWGGGDIPSKQLIDYMKANTDPRLSLMFQPGANAGGNYAGLDPSLPSNTQSDLANGGTLSRYNFANISQNINIPGMLINAAETYFYISEYYLNGGNDAAAKTAYENGVKISIDYYAFLSGGTVSNVLKTAYLASPGVIWLGTSAAKLNLIATQKWINYSVLQPLENWAEVRRLKLPVLTFTADNTNAQKMPPNRWQYPTNEQTYNAENYAAVKDNDKITTKIFWDVK